MKKAINVKSVRFALFAGILNIMHAPINAIGNTEVTQIAIGFRSLCLN